MVFFPVVVLTFPWKKYLESPQILLGLIPRIVSLLPSGYEPLQGRWRSLTMLFLELLMALVLLNKANLHRTLKAVLHNRVVASFLRCLRPLSAHQLTVSMILFAICSIVV